MSDFQIDRGENKSKIEPTNKVGKDIPSNSIAGYDEDQLKDLPLREVLPTLILQDTSDNIGKINFYKTRNCSWKW